MLSRGRSEGCISDLVLDRLLTEELASGEMEVLRRHLADCTICRSRLEELELDRARFVLEMPALGAGPQGDRAREQLGKVREPEIRRIWPAIATVAVAAAALVLVLGSHDWGRSSDGEADAIKNTGHTPTAATRSKGGGALGFYVTRGELSERGASGDWLGSGEHLQFYYSSPRAGYLALLSVDGAKHVSVYYPSSDLAASIPAGSEVPLASSVVLDDTPGEEVVYGIFCSEPFTLVQLRSDLIAKPERVPEAPGCDVEQVRYWKRPKR